MNEEEWKTVYDVQIYVTSLSAISDCNWNKLEFWINLHQDGFIYKLRRYYLYFLKMIYISFFCYVSILVMRRFQSCSIF